MRTNTIAVARERPARHADTIAYGNLLVPASAKDAVDAAFAYLRRDRVERALIDRLEAAPRPTRLVIDARDDDSYSPSDNVIHWDPHSALQTTEGGTQSPALGLGHEIDHAVEALYTPRTAEQLSETFDARYDDAEEHRVIRGSEAHAARTLGEDARHDHAGSAFAVRRPTDRVAA